LQKFSGRYWQHGTPVGSFFYVWGNTWGKLTPMGKTGFQCRLSALCLRISALFSRPSALCSLLSSLFPLRSALCALRSGLGSWPSALSPTPSALGLLPSARCSLRSAQGYLPLCLSVSLSFCSLSLCLSALCISALCLPVFESLVVEFGRAGKALLICR
jgi:hypothetical protein